MTDVFISYSRRDQPFARRLYEALAQNSKKVWIDWNDIPDGVSFMNAIRDAIENADSVLFIVSRNSLSSEICNEELAYAIACSKRLFPVVRERIVGDTELLVKGSWVGKTWQSKAVANMSVLQSTDWAFFDNDEEFDSALRSLLESLDIDLPYRRQHTQLLIRARDWERGEMNPSFLLQGDEIALAEKWLAGSTNKLPEVGPLHARFISASRQVDIERQRRQRQQIRLTRMMGVASAVLGTLTLLGIIALILVSAQLQTTVQDQREAAAARDEASTRVVLIGSTLSPIPITITAFGIERNVAQTQISDLASTITPIAATIAAARAEVLYRQGAAYYLSGEFELANQRIGQALKMVPSPPSNWLYDYANSCLRTNRPDCVREYFPQVIAAQPLLATGAFLSLALVERDSGNYAEARSYVEKAEASYAANGIKDSLNPIGAYVIDKVKVSIAFYQGDQAATLIALDKYKRWLDQPGRQADRKELVYYYAATYSNAGETAQACTYWAMFNKIGETFPPSYRADERERNAARQQTALNCS
jgi:tetratricopeptide (TPR) repeat protein